jgi:hypothetical protein
MTRASDLRQFLSRPWERLRESKDRHVAGVIARGGADAAFRIVDQLREHARSCSAIVSDEDRQADLETAVRLRRLIDRANARRHDPR